MEASNEALSGRAVQRLDMDVSTAETEGQDAVLLWYLRFLLGEEQPEGVKVVREPHTSCVEASSDRDDADVFPEL